MRSTTPAAAAVHIMIPGKAWREDAFALDVEGDCMAPMYRDGDRVVCWPVANHREVEEGHPCAVFLHNGPALLKLVYHAPDFPGQLVLRCRNQGAEYRRPIIVAVDDVRLIARAVYRVPAVR